MTGLRVPGSTGISMQVRFRGRKSSRISGKQPVSLESVRAFLQANAPDIGLIETDDSSATVELAAKVHGVEPAQIAKTICLRVGDKTLLIVASGIARLDNRKVKDVLGGKGRMLDPEQVLAVTGHSVGGVCPFGLLSPLPAIFRCGASKRLCPRRVRAMRRSKSPRKGSST